jgi:tripartite-type tricarboxylate transporter receptor subunit TctC
MCRLFLVGTIPLMLAMSVSATHCAELQSFYEGKTITMLISTTPGGATDVAGRLTAHHLGKYIPGNPNVTAQNMPGAGGTVSAIT